MELIMSKLWKLVAEESLQYILYISLSVLILILTVITTVSSPTAFPKYFGGINPLVMVPIFSVLGFILLSLLLYNGQFAIYQEGNYKGILTALALAIPFAVFTILVDWKVPYPEDTNVLFPGSLFFYPAIGYVVEILFHIVPFCIMYFALGSLLGKTSPEKIIWFSILVAAILEPVFQVVFSAGQRPVWSQVTLVLHLFLFNTTQLLLFRRYDFITMYAFRLSYYVMWHIVWGYLRLGLLF